MKEELKNEVPADDASREIQQAEVLEDADSAESEEQQLRAFTRDYSPLARSELSYKIRIARVRRELGIIDEAEEIDTIQKLKNEFDERFSGQKDRFEQEALELRDVETISRNKGVIFVHGIPLGNLDSQANTQMNNDIVYTEGLSTEDRIGLIINEHPTISCSTVKISKHGVGGSVEEDPTMYPFGVVIDAGTVLSAHRKDAGLATISNTAKHRKYDKDEPDTSIQPKIAANIEYAIDGPFSRDYEKLLEEKHGRLDAKYGGGHGKLYNEIGVAQPRVSGFFVDEDVLGRYVENGHSTLLAKRWNVMGNIFKKYPEVPISIKTGNKVQEFFWKDGSLHPVRVDGKVDMQKPSKTLEEYSWKNPEHAKFKNIEKREYRPDHLEPISINKVLSESINRNLGSYIDAEIISLIAKALETGADHLAISDAIKSDFSAALRENRVRRKEMLRKSGAENSTLALRQKDGMIPFLDKGFNEMKRILERLATKLEAAGHVDIATQIKNMDIEEELNKPA